MELLYRLYDINEPGNQPRVHDLVLKTGLEILEYWSRDWSRALNRRWKQPFSCRDHQYIQRTHCRWRLCYSQRNDSRIFVQKFQEPSTSSGERTLGRNLQRCQDWKVESFLPKYFDGKTHGICCCPDVFNGKWLHAGVNPAVLVSVFIHLLRLSKTYARPLVDALWDRQRGHGNVTFVWVDDVQRLSKPRSKRMDGLVPLRDCWDLPKLAPY